MKNIGAPPQGATVPCSVDIGSSKNPTYQEQQNGAPKGKKKGKK